MNKFACSQNALVGFGEISESNGVVCPKPHKGGPFITNPPLLQINSQEVEDCDLKAGTELLDMILTKGRYDVEDSNFQLGSSPPFFCGSPPSRASNPLIQDSHFGNNNFLPIPPVPESPSPPPPFSSSDRVTRGGCIRGKFGNNSTPVRIEGFNCRGISAVA
ncbi:uncharacterized protein LOC132040555 [Lycium ferocissimum]|uniref:uncharacterized protein LOC132040555 n=1 Tax=Lycium ferocissimum TaxID=112874 RepID=UPI0028169B46|nr:uncharacterized protein LOC132040555 [Lycium ferocissimum]